LAGEIDDIRSRIDIVSLVGRSVNLKKTGKNYQGLCPFHDDKRPSFSVNPIIQRYRCWSCGESGDIFNWVMKTQNVEFGEALETLAKEAGVEISKKGGGVAARSERAKNLEIMEAANTFFVDQLSKSMLATEYLSKRGMSAEVISDWEIGYAPDVGEALAVHLKKLGFSLSLCRSLFLVEEDNQGGFYDKFRGRIMFPIRDDRGDLVAFGGRVIGDGMPKYINSSDTPLYRKSKVLYGANIAASAVARDKPRRMVLCEGYFDVIACHEAGVRGAVASLGTALSEEHADKLARWSDELVVLYDADSAGQKAAERALEVLKPKKLAVRVALMPKGSDPDTLLRESGPEAVKQAVEGATTPTAFRIRQIVALHEEKDAAFWSAIVEALVHASDIPEMERYIEQLVSEHAGVRDQLTVRESLRKHVLQRRKVSAKPLEAIRAVPFQMTATSLQVAEASLIAALLTPGLRKIAHEALALPELMVSDVGRKFSVQYAEVFGQDSPTGDASYWIGKLPQEAQDIVHECANDVRFNNMSDRYVKDSISKLTKLLERNRLQRIKQNNDPDRINQVQEAIVRLKDIAR